MSIGITRDPRIKLRNDTGTDLLIMLNQMTDGEGAPVAAYDQSSSFSYKRGKYLANAWTADRAKKDYGRLYAYGEVEIFEDGILVVSESASRTFTTTMDGEVTLQ